MESLFFSLLLLGFFLFPGFLEALYESIDCLLDDAVKYCAQNQGDDEHENLKHDDSPLFPGLSLLRLGMIYAIDTMPRVHVAKESRRSFLFHCLVWDEDGFDTIPPNDFDFGHDCSP